MSRNASGTYTLPSGNPVISGTLIEASWANNTLSDLASAMTDSLSRSGQGGMTAAFRAFDGTSSVPGIAWGSETTTGWYRAGAGDMRLVVTGSEVIRYQSTGVAVTGTLAVSGAITATGGVTGNASTATALQNARTIWGQSFNGTANVSGALTGATDLTASGNGSFGGTLAVTGATTLNSPATITANSSSDALRITQTGSGNALYIEDVAADATPFVVSSTGVVGIGTTTPDNITSAGIALVSNSGFYPQLVQRNTTADANASYMVFEKNRSGAVVQNGDILGNLVFRGFDGTNYLQAAAIWARVSATPGTNDMPGTLVFGTTADGGSGVTDRMALDQAGNLGLGVTPSAWWSSVKALQVNGASLLSATTEATLSANAFLDSGIAWRYRVNGSATYAEQASGAFRWYTAPSGTAGNAISFTQAMTLDASGNLGIGTSSPTNRLHVQGAGSTYISVISQNAGSGSGLITANATNTYGIGAGTASGGSGLEFRDVTNSATRMVIDTSGNLLVGTTSGSATRLNVVPAVGNSGVKVTQAGAGDYCYQAIASNNGGTFYFHYFLAGSTYVGQITSNGTTTSYISASDYRLKENVQPMTGALAKVAALKPCTYKWKADGSDGEGFIAHELAEIVPQCVTGEKDAVDAEGNPKYQGIDTSFLVATLTAAIQELKAINDAQAETITALTARVTALETAA